MRDTFHDLETWCERPLKDGSYQYADEAEIMIWSWADGDGEIYVWDLVNDTLNYVDDLTGEWVEEPLFQGLLPTKLATVVADPEALVWFHNGGQFDFPVLDRALPRMARLIPMTRRRDTMVQAFAHALPGALEKLGEVLNLNEDKKKMKEGKRLVRLFCMPQLPAQLLKDLEDGAATIDTHPTQYMTWVRCGRSNRATKRTHPADWQRFIEYAGGDIVTMREAHKLIPMWNYKGKQVELCHTDWAINGRGFAVDLELAAAAVDVSDESKAVLAKRARDATDGAVSAATQRDALLAHILAIYGVELPDMRADTLERRMADEDLPEPVRELISIRLQASMNSAAKYKTLRRSVSKDGRLRGCHQFRGAGRTGRWAHRMFQPGNLLRPTMSSDMIEACIAAIKDRNVELLDMISGNPPLALGNAVRGVIIARRAAAAGATPKPGKKLIVADLSNIEGRDAAWLAGEEWKLKAFADFDKGIGYDLYIVAYAKSFNVDPATVGKKSPERQIGKVEELMFQYGGGVGAWITGAATYGIDLDRMTEQVYPTLPEWAIEEAQQFLGWLDDQCEAKAAKRAVAANKKHALDNDALQAALRESDAQLVVEKIKARHGLSDRTFVACDAIKRLWRKAHPQISSYWKEIEDTVRMAMDSPGVTFPCRKVKIRRDGSWLRIGLPSSRALCYPNPKIEKDGSITYTGLNQYTRQWGRVSTYGGKLFENITQAVACDQLAECMPMVEEWISPEAFIDHVRQFETEDGIVLHVHDELVCQVPDDSEFSADKLSTLMCSNLGWNEGVPLAAAGFETQRYAKE